MIRTITSPNEDDHIYAFKSSVTKKIKKAFWNLYLLFKFNMVYCCCVQLVTGTGPQGRIRAQDIEQFTPSAAPVSAPVSPPPSSIPAAPVPAMAPPGAQYTDIPLTNMRQVTVLTMVTCKNYSRRRVEYLFYL